MNLNLIKRIANKNINVSVLNIRKKEYNMENKILNILPTKEGFGANKGKYVTDWNKCVGTKVDIRYNDKIYYGILILSYQRKEQKVKVIYDSKEYLINTTIFLKGNLPSIFNIQKPEYEYKIGEIITTHSSKIKVLKQFRNDKNIKTYLMECQLCKFPNGKLFTYEVNEHNVRQGKGCPCCAKQKLIPEINSVYATNTEYLKYFKNIEDSKGTTISSSKKITFKCPICGEEKIDCMNNISYYGFSCSKCGDGISYPEKFMFNLLEQLNIDFITEYSPEWIKPKRYDFYFKLNSKEYILEIDGGLGHGKEKHPKSNVSIEESQEIDTYKDRMAKEHDIEVIRIDCDYRHNDRLEYIKNNILNNEKLNQIFDLSKIDWLKCHEFSCSSRIHEACKLFNNGIKSIGEISKIMKMNYTTIIDYLKQGAILGLCNYSVDLAIEIRNTKNADKLKKIFCKPIICLNDNTIFESATECERQSLNIFGFKIDRRQIKKICDGEKDNYKGLRFKFYNIA